VVRCLEWRTGLQRRTDRQARQRAHRADLDGGVGVEVGQQTGQTAREQGLARTGRPEHEQVMTSGRGHLQRLDRLGVADDVGQVTGLDARGDRHGRFEGIDRDGSSRAPCPMSTSRSEAAAMMRMPGTSRASSALPLGTTTAAAPARREASTVGSTPATGRSRPSSESSPTWTIRSMAAASMMPVVASAATAMPRSNPEPCLGSEAGERLTVIWSRSK